MANKTIDMSKIRQILRFFTQGKSKVYIRQQTGASRNTVKRYIRKFLQEKLIFEDLAGMQDAELEVMFGSSQPADMGERYDELQRLLPDMEKRFKQRGINSLNLLNHYFKTPDQIQLFDNSKSLQLVAEIRQGKIVELHDPVPSWVEKHLTEHFSKEQKVSDKKTLDMDSIEEVRKSYQAFRQKADELLNPQKEAQQKETKKTQTNKRGKKPGL